MTMSVRDWCIFRQWMCVELSKKKNILFTARSDLLWYNSFENILYTIDADRVNKPNDGYIYFFKRIFFYTGAAEVNDETIFRFMIQWCDWESLQSVFKQIDEAIFRGNFNSEHELIRRGVLFGHVPDSCNVSVSTPHIMSATESAA